MDYKLKIEEFVFILVGIYFYFSFRTSHISNHWVIQVIDLLSSLSFFEILKPIYLPSLLRFYVYRPVAAYLLKTYYHLFHFNFQFLYLFLSGIIALLGIIIYRFHLSLAPKNKKTAYISSFLYIISLPVVISLVNLIDMEIVGTFFAFSALIIFLKIKPQNPKKKKFLYISGFILLSVIAILTKETIRVFFPIILLVFYLIKPKKVNNFQKILLLFVFSIAVISSFQTLETLPVPSWKLSLTFEHISFFFFHNISQLFFVIFPSGVLVLLISTLLKKDEKVLYYLFLPGMFLVISIPIILIEGMHSLIFFSSETLSIVYFFGVIFILALILKFWKGSDKIKFYSGIILFSLAITFLIIFIPTTRVDVSIRTFTIILPFLIYLIIDSLFKIKSKISNTFSGPKKNIFYILTILVSILILYHFVAPTFNVIKKSKALEVNIISKKYLANLNLSNSIVFYHNWVNPTRRTELKILGKGKKEKTNFEFLESTAPQDKKRIKNEICSKSFSKEKIYFHFLNPKILLKKDLRNNLKGDFRWTEKNTLYWLTPPDPKRNYGLVQLKREITYSPSTELLNLVNSHNSKLLYSYDKNYSQIPEWLEDFPRRIRKNIPFILPFKYSAKIYKIKRSKLDCSNFYYLERKDNQSWRWMSQNATVSLNSSKEREKEMNFTVWSYSKTRKIIIYLNNEKIFQKEIPVEPTRISLNLTLKPGINTLKFYSVEGCDKPSEIENKSDERCLSFGFRKNKEVLSA